MVILWAVLVLAVLVLMPGAEVLLALFALALLFAFAEWLTGIGQEAPGMFAMALLTLAIRAVRLRVAARFW
jgi:hypothetical protein